MWNRSCRIAFAAMALTGLLITAVSCTKRAAQDGPQSALSRYVDVVFHATSIDDKSKLLELTSGKVHEMLEALNPESCRKKFLNSKKTLVSIKIRDERKLDSQKVSLTYEVTYGTETEGSKDLVTNKRSALIEMVNGNWKIAEVRNLKTFIEHQNEVTF